MGPHCSRGNLAWGCKSAEIFEQAALLASDRIIKEQEPMGRHKLGGPDCVGRVGRQTAQKTWRKGLLIFTQGVGPRTYRQALNLYP